MQLEIGGGCFKRREAEGICEFRGVGGLPRRAGQGVSFFPPRSSPLTSASLRLEMTSCAESFRSTTGRPRTKTKKPPPLRMIHETIYPPHMSELPRNEVPPISLSSQNRSHPRATGSRKRTSRRPPRNARRSSTRCGITSQNIRPRPRSRRGTRRACGPSGAAPRHPADLPRLRRRAHQ